ncbi:MAG: SDR family NAD(P)-dependent oxidoreductase [Myxococcota bacterium]
MGDRGVCVVFGVGPGLGAAAARRFAESGWTVAVVARTRAKVDAFAAEVGGHGFVADATDLESVQQALSEVRAALGPVHTLVWNVGGGVFGDFDQVGLEALDLALDTNTRALFAAAKAVVPDMRALGGGNLLITGATASLRGKPFTTAFAAGKAAQRSLAQSLARQLWPAGIHVALVIVDGMVDLPTTRARMPDKGDEAFVSPEGYADTLVFLAGQDRRAWTFELEVRPHVEAW